jgi:peptidoglycan/xylan/chitin deacetylase (PgdA/CDA1 family)
MRQIHQPKIRKWSRLALCSILGMCTVSIPVTLAFALSVTGSSDLLTIGATSKPNVLRPTAAVKESLLCTPIKGYYALTFSHGPNPESSEDIAKALRDSRSVATFFDVGQWVVKYPKLFNAERKVGNVSVESYTPNIDLTKVSVERRVQELQTAAKVMGFQNSWFRPTRTSNFVESDADRMGLELVGWSTDTRDNRIGTTVNAVVKRALTVKSGGIILLHNTPLAAEAIPHIVGRLRARHMCPGLLESSQHGLKDPSGNALGVRAIEPRP